jgi:hypothetical protein
MRNPALVEEHRRWGRSGNKKLKYRVYKMIKLAGENQGRDIFIFNASFYGRTFISCFKCNTITFTNI